ncbi:MAG: hypothetical protein HOQ24_12730, partial [Mycobacteriaceae bacterium]|nr:hypothetical protein [Mycobacteriaceae bacterium]
MTWHRGALLSRPAWLAERVDRHADAWQLPAGADRSRAAATLWWSMSVYAMM